MTTVKVLPPTKLEEYQRMVRFWKKCTACAIGGCAHKHVFGRGTLDARVVMVGEAPGRTEDMLGVPFIGLAGRVLDQALLDTGLDVGVFITNMVACRPFDVEGVCENNRPPSEEEIRNCTVRLQNTIEIIKPKVVIGLGKVAEENIPGIVKERYRFFAVYHPAYILRNGGVKSVMYTTWVADIRRVMKYAL